MSQCNLEEVAVASDLQGEAQEEKTTSPQLPSYSPYKWAFLNRLLDVVDKVTNGRAGLLQRFVSFSFIGGFAALVNLAVFSLTYHVIKLPASISDMEHNVIASVLATELSIMANFIPNDYFTFRHLAGHDRSWGARCLRFHITAVGGNVLTFLIQFGFTYYGHLNSTVGQAIGLIIALFYNFSFHHIFTYRHVKIKTVGETA